MKNEHSLNKFFIQYIHRCRRRVLVIVLIKVAIWWTTIAIADIVLSSVVTQNVLIPACIIAGFISGYLLWKKLPGEDRIVTLIDQSLSLKEGLVTAFQYRESNELYINPLIKQITARLQLSKPEQLFPLSIPKVIAIWPFFLIVLMLQPGSGDFLPKGSLRSQVGSLSSVKDKTKDSSHRNDDEKSGSAVSMGMKPHSRELPLQESVNDNQRTAGKDNIAMADKDAGSSVEKKNLAGLHRAEKKDRHPDSFQPSGRGPDSNNNQTESNGSNRISSVSGLDSGKDSSIAGKMNVVNGTGIAKDKLTSGSAKQTNKWDTGQWKAAYSDALQVLIQQDMPDDYKLYVRSYFDTVQEEEGAYGQHKRY